MATIDWENVPFARPEAVDKYLYQVDFKLNGGKGDPETSIHKWGCCFMSHLTIVQMMHKKPFKYNQILEIYDKCMQAGWLGEGCWVKDAVSIMAYAERYITGDKPRYKYTCIMTKGVSNKEATYNMGYMSASRLPNKSNIYFCVVDFDTRSGPEYGGHHFQLFSSTGCLLYDPNKTELGSGYVGVSKIRFWRVDNYNE